VVTCSPDQTEAVMKLTLAANLPALVIGQVGGDKLEIKVNGHQLTAVEVNDLSRTWREAIPCAMS